MITFQSENTFFITEGDDDHFLVIITLCPLLKSDERKGDHYGVITGSLRVDYASSPSKVIITCFITPHYLAGDGFG